MDASRLIGRVGGLAVALGVGVAIVSGAGAAAATDGSEGEAGATVSNPANSTAGEDSGSDATSAGSTGTARRPGLQGPSRLLSPPTMKLPTMKLPTMKVPTIKVPDRPDIERPRKNTATQDDSNDNKPTAQVDVDVPVRVAAPPVRPKAVETVVAAVEDLQTTARDWVATPRAVAGRAVERGGPVTVGATLVPSGTVGAPVLPRAPQVSTTTTRFVANLFNEMFRPLSGTGTGGTIPVDSAADWMLAAGARRELGGDSIVVGDPTVEFTDGIIHGDLGVSSGQPLRYTVVGDPTGGGKVVLYDDGTYAFLPDLATMNADESETFKVLASTTTPFVTALEDLPVLGAVVAPIVVKIQQVPILGQALGPVIGYAQVVTVEVNAAEEADGRPVAFTTMVPSSVDGTLISVNFFPAAGLDSVEDEAPTILTGPGLGGAGLTDPYGVWGLEGITPGVGTLRGAGYNVVTWDPRGEHASAGRLQLDSPEYEGQDVVSIIDWTATQPTVLLDAPGDPRMGMVGGSYGGGIQWVTAGLDDRVDAIVPAISWNSLLDSLYTNDAFKTSFSALLLLDLVETGARINPQIYAGILTGVLTGFLTPSQQDLLARSGPGGLDPDLLAQIDAPTLVLQGTADMLFPLQQSIDNVDGLDSSVPVQMIWFCGGHGYCLPPQSAEAAEAQENLLMDRTMQWLDYYVKRDGQGLPDSPAFTWVDQNGEIHSSSQLPSNDLTDPFYGPLMVTSDDGRYFLPIVPLIGGSGPQTEVPFPVSLGLGTPAKNAVTVPIDSPPAGSEPVYLVGAPQLSFTYSGVGTSRHVYAQIVDTETGLVVGNIVTPVDVTLDGKEHVATVPMEAIAYTMDSDSKLELQIVASATPYLNGTEYGGIHISGVELAMPTANPAEMVSGAAQQDLAVVA